MHLYSIFRFFNPSCEQLYRNTQSKQKGTELIEDKNKDSIAIPFYTLLGEIFEIHGHLQVHSLTKICISLVFFINELWGKLGCQPQFSLFPSLNFIVSIGEK